MANKDDPKFEQRAKVKEYVSNSIGELSTYVSEDKIPSVVLQHVISNYDALVDRIMRKSEAKDDFDSFKNAVKNSGTKYGTTRDTYRIDNVKEFKAHYGVADSIEDIILYGSKERPFAYAWKHGGRQAAYTTAIIAAMGVGSCIYQAGQHNCNGGAEVKPTPTATVHVQPTAGKPGKTPTIDKSPGVTATATPVKENCYACGQKAQKVLKGQPCPDGYSKVKPECSPAPTEIPTAGKTGKRSFKSTQAADQNPTGN